MQNENEENLAPRMADSESNPKKEVGQKQTLSKDSEVSVEMANTQQDSVEDISFNLSAENVEKLNPTVFGIYSFPKSGNTWLRHIFAKIFGVDHGDYQVFIPDIHQKSIPCKLSEHAGNHYFCYKSHTPDYIKKYNGLDFETNIVLHIRRNPLDLFLSQMNFISNNTSSAAAIPFNNVVEIRDSKLLEYYFGCFMVAGTAQPTFLASGTYFSNNINWMNRAEQYPHLNIICIRYEDLIDDPVNTLLPVVTQLGFGADTLREAFASVAQEFQRDGKFYWKMGKNYYREYLKDEWINDFIRYRAPELERLGYTDL